MKLNTRISRGMPSSRLCRNPEVRQMNRMEKKARAILQKRMMEKLQAEHDARLAPKNEPVPDQPAAPKQGLLKKLTSFMKKPLW